MGDRASKGARKAATNRVREGIGEGARTRSERESEKERERERFRERVIVFERDGYTKTHKELARARARARERDRERERERERERDRWVEIGSAFVFKVVYHWLSIVWKNKSAVQNQRLASFCSKLCHDHKYTEFQIRTMMQLL